MSRQLIKLCFMPLNMCYSVVKIAIGFIPPIIPGMNQIPALISLGTKGLYLCWYIIYMPTQKVLGTVDQVLQEVQCL